MNERQVVQHLRGVVRKDAKATQRITRVNRIALAVLVLSILLLGLFGCTDNPTTPEIGGRVVVYEFGGSDGPIKPEKPKPDTTTPPLPPPPAPPVQGTIELQADGRFAPIVAGTCRVRVYGWAEGGYLDIDRVAYQVQEVGQRVGAPIYRPGLYVAPGARLTLDETLPCTGTAVDVGVTLEMRDGSVVTYRRLFR